MEPYGTQGRPPEPPEGPDELVGAADPGSPDPFSIGHRYLPDPADPLDQAERRLVVDDYDSQVNGPGARTQASLGGREPGSGRSSGDPRAGLPDADPGSV